MSRLLNWTLIISLFHVSCLFGEVKPTLSAQVKRRVSWNDPSYLYAQFKAENFPTNTPLDLIWERVDKSVACTKKVIVDEQNRLIDIETGKEWIASFGKFERGESFTFTIKNDKTLSTSITVVPQPIEAQDKAGHKLSVRWSSLPGIVFIIEASGFEPFEEVQMCSISGSEVLRHPYKASADGTILSTIMPAVTDKISGKASFEIKGKTTDNLQVSYWWGAGIFRENRPDYIAPEENEEF